MKYHALFSSKDKSKKLKCRLLQFLFGALRVNMDYTGEKVNCSVRINSITTEKQTTTFSSANFNKMLSPSYIILRIQTLEGKQCRSR